jgi:hypothetical protein
MVNSISFLPKSFLVSRWQKKKFLRTSFVVSNNWLGVVMHELNKVIKATKLFAQYKPAWPRADHH